MPRPRRVARRSLDWRRVLLQCSADGASALICDDWQTRERITLPTRNILSPPATDSALVRLDRLPPRVAASLRPVWSHADGARFAALGTGYDRCLVELHPIAAMADETQAFHDSLFALDDDPHGLLDALVIGGAPMCANRLVVATKGRRAGAVLLFDHESLEAEVFAPDAAGLVLRVAEDPLAVGRRLGSIYGLGETGQATAIQYVAGRAGPAH